MEQMVKPTVIYGRFLFCAGNGGTTIVLCELGIRIGGRCETVRGRIHEQHSRGRIILDWGVFERRKRWGWLYRSLTAYRSWGRIYGHYDRFQEKTDERKLQSRQSKETSPVVSTRPRIGGTGGGARSCRPGEHRLNPGGSTLKCAAGQGCQGSPGEPVSSYHDRRKVPG